MRIPCFGVLHAAERHDRSYGNDVFRIGETREIKRQADVPDEVWWLQHGGEMRYRHGLVHRNGSQELVRGDVVEVHETHSSASKEKRASEGDSERCYWLARLKTCQSVIHDDPGIYDKYTLD